MRSSFRYAGVAASAILIVMGLGSIIVAANGHSEVGTTLKQEAIVGTPDMTPKAIAVAAEDAGLTNVTLPTCSVAGKSIDTGSEAKCFASYMRIHALEATGGKTYAQLPRFQGPNGTFTDDANVALKNPKSGKPVDNPVRSLWINETALATALNTSFFAQSVATFSIVMGVALLLTGIGFLVLTTGLLGATVAGRRRRTATTSMAVPSPS